VLLVEFFKRKWCKGFLLREKLCSFALERISDMAKYFDCGYDFFIQRVKLDENGCERKDGDEINIEEDIGGCVYKSITGVSEYGNPRVYVENYAEDEQAQVYVNANGVRAQNELTLTLYFFDALNAKDDVEALQNISEAYHKFVSYVSGCKVIYRDTARKRKVLMYLSSATSHKNDILYGVKYKEVQFEFTNVYGRSFAVDDDFPDKILEQNEQA